MNYFTKSRTISLIIGLCILTIFLPGVASAYSASPNAQYISDTIPSIMNAGQLYSFNNHEEHGNVNWNEASVIRLGGIGDYTGDAAKFGPVGVSIVPELRYTRVRNTRSPSK